MKKLILLSMFLCFLTVTKATCPEVMFSQIVNKGIAPGTNKCYYMLRVIWRNVYSQTGTIKYVIKNGNTVLASGCIKATSTGVNNPAGRDTFELPTNEWVINTCGVYPAYSLERRYSTQACTNNNTCGNVILTSDNSILWDGNKIHFQGTLYLKGQVLPVATTSPYTPTAVGEYYNTNGKSIYVNKLNKQTRFIVYDLMGREIKQMIYQPNALLPRRVTLVGDKYFIFKQIHTDRVVKLVKNNNTCHNYSGNVIDDKVKESITSQLPLFLKEIGL